MILKILGAREMVQWVGGHTAFAEDLSWVASPHIREFITTCNSHSKIQCLQGPEGSWTHLHMTHIKIDIIKNKIFLKDEELAQMQ